MELVGGAFGRAETSWMKLVPYKRGPRNIPLSFPPMRTQWKVGDLKASPHQAMTAPWTWISSLPNCKKQCLMFINYLVYGILLQFLNGLLFSCSVVSDSWRLHGPQGPHQVPLSLGFPRQEHWSGSLFPFPGDLPNPGITLSWHEDSLPLSHERSSWMD